MVKWIEGKFGRGAVPWVLLCGMLALGVAGVASTVFFATTGLEIALNVSIPAIVVGFVGFLVTLFILDDSDHF